MVFSLFTVGALFAADVAITSVGQSADAMMVRVLMRNLNIAADYDALMSIDVLEDQKVLIVVVGGSSKGLGAAGINQEEEKSRGVSLIEAARGKDIKNLVRHV
jgi:dihydropteroate synthase